MKTNHRNTEAQRREVQRRSDEATEAGTGNVKRIGAASLLPVSLFSVSLCLCGFFTPPDDAAPVAAELNVVASAETIEIQSKAVGRTLKYRVLLPNGYASGTERYPAIYLLHGLGGSYVSFSKSLPKSGVWRDRAIVVLVDVGNSWYFNWPDSTDSDTGARQRNRWEDYVVNELVADVDRRFRTDPSRRGVCGWSMGGYGAALLSLHHPDKFRFAAILAGALALPRQMKQKLAAGEDVQILGRQRLSKDPTPGIDVPGFSSQAERTPRGRLSEEPEFYDRHDPYRLLTELMKDPSRRPPHFFVACGLDDGLLAQSREFVKLLQTHSVPFTYMERRGGHERSVRRPAVAAALSAAVTALSSESARP